MSYTTSHRCPESSARIAVLTLTMWAAHIQRERLYPPCTRCDRDASRRLRAVPSSPARRWCAGFRLRRRSGATRQSGQWSRTPASRSPSPTATSPRASPGA